MNRARSLRRRMGGMECKIDNYGILERYFQSLYTNIIANRSINRIGNICYGNSNLNKKPLALL